MLAKYNIFSKFFCARVLKSEFRITYASELRNYTSFYWNQIKFLTNMSPRSIKKLFLKNIFSVTPINQDAGSFLVVTLPSFDQKKSFLDEFYFLK